ncbi:MAG: uncharacterized protein JWN84_4476 [Nocardioides sp.]|nr:uncharacterized protein [Nocardioides sp.]
MTAPAAQAPEALGALEALGPIGLDELLLVAPLQTRVDRKYVIARRDLANVFDELPRDTRVLELDGRREMTYRSTYLDTPDRRSYLTSGRSRRGRWKVRGRLYLDTGGSFLETKTAGPRGQTVKRRVAHPDPVECGITPAGAALITETIGADTVRDLEPVLTTAYRRTTLLLPAGSTRVTIDVDLGWTSVITGKDLERTSIAVIETKTGSTPSAVDRLLWSHGHRPVRLSKYGAGMAALHHELPHLKWHRALDRHLNVRPDLRPNPPRSPR